MISLSARHQPTSPVKPLSIRIPHSALRIALSLAILLGYLYAGQWITGLLGVPVPGSVAGMVLLTASLRSGVLRLEWVRPAADVLVRHLAFLFVPPGVGLMLYFGLIRDEWPAIVAGTVASTAAVFVVVGLLAQRLARHD